MGIINYVGAISASVRRNLEFQHKNKNKKESYEDKKNKISKEQHMKWAEEDKCYCCGAPHGEEKGICDECRWS